MKVILLKDVPSIGRKHDVKNIVDGYAMNFLIPRKLAKKALDVDIAEVEKLKTIREAKQVVQADLLEKNLKALNGVSVEIHAKTNEKGHLFKGINAEDIVYALKDQVHIDIDADHIALEHPIKEVGEFDIEVHTKEALGQFRLIVQSTK